MVFSISFNFLNKSSKIWIVLLDYPFIWGWKVMLKFNFILKACWILGQRWELKLGSWLDTINLGTPCNMITVFTYNLANLSNGFIVFMDRKKSRLRSQSSTTHIKSLPLFPLWNLIIKSIIISSHFHSGIKMDCKGPTGFWCSTFTSWHIIHWTI